MNRYIHVRRAGPNHWHAVFLDRHGRWIIVRNAARLPIIYRSQAAALQQARFAHISAGGSVAPWRAPQLELPLTGGRLAHA